MLLGHLKDSTFCVSVGGHLVDFGLKALVRDLKCEMNAELI